MINYDLEIENSEKYNVIPLSDIYDFRSTPLEIWNKLINRN